MSLLNDVLQDLDARQSTPAAAAVRTAPPSVRAHAADDFKTVDWAARLRPVAVVLLLAALTVGWLLLRPQSELPASPAGNPTRTAPPAPVAAIVPHTEPEQTPAVDTIVPEPVGDPATAVHESPPRAPSLVTAPTAAQAPSNAGVEPRPVYLPLKNAVAPVREAPGVRESSRPDKVVISKSIRPVARDPIQSARDKIAGGELAEAEQMLRQRLQVAHGDIRARELLLGLMLRGNRTDAALHEVSAGLELKPGHGKFILIKARLLAQLDQGEEAIALLERASRVRAIRSERLQMLGALYQQAEQYDRAAGNYRALLSAQPDIAAAWVGLAICLDAQGEAGAADAYRRALRLGGLPVTAAAYARQRLGEME